MSIETLDSRVRKAQKPHTCDYCGEAIPIGHYYQYDKLKLDYIYEWKSHTHCHHIVQALWNWIDPDDCGLGGECFREYCQEFCVLYICPGCDKWGGEDCADDKYFCANKISDLLRAHDFRRVKKDGHWSDTWELVPAIPPASDES